VGEGVEEENQCEDVGVEDEDGEVKSRSLLSTRLCRAE
jgi:hypothetical protein